ncbi:hypothetical protein PHMEG_00018022 [Phytophthora megakarya]|uniref:CCHC-type domain-containing protein n=1 Tax=Phytophthora megakarya TaxID=4795 RepID=A0A225VWL4_9STRA|nr:hypothetical protein PHMEG_00018022 [Phytophthora megakarya]
MPKPTTDASWEVEVSEKTGRPIRWNGQNFQYYKKLMEIAARKTSAELFQVMTGVKKYDENFSDLQKSAWEAWQVDIQELIFSSVCTDMGQQLMDLEDGTSMWKYLCDRYEGTANEQTKAMTKRQLYAQLESAKCNKTGKVEAHLNYMSRLKGRLQTVGMTLDDAVFSGMLVSSLPTNDRFDRLRGFVDAGMTCVDTSEKVVAMAITFDKANQADGQLNRAYSNGKFSQGQQNKSGGGSQDKTKEGNENAHPKGKGKTRACFVCGSTEHIKVNCPNRANKQSGYEENEEKLALVNEVDGEQVVMYIDDVFYVPDAEYGLFSPGLAHEQGFEFDYDQETRSFVISMEGRTVVVAKPHEATWGFEVTHPSLGSGVGPEDRPLANFTLAEGVGTLKLWHERLCHTCPQYLKTMVDKEMVQGMMITKRQQDTCDACHLGKQKKKKHRKKLDRATHEPNQVVYADLLFPSKENGSRKASDIVNNHLKEYVLWAKRQAGRLVKKVLTYKIKQVLTDKGGEFVNEAMEACP